MELGLCFHALKIVPPGVKKKGEPLNGKELAETKEPEQFEDPSAEAQEGGRCLHLVGEGPWCQSLSPIHSYSSLAPG
ncbi:hypothetical protein P7K49_012617 [Saguinus oedipus]|uniref:Uncharacterized protein n=1 Tax=Saguinus oedipus TaxID=9490 RepID=A0ABQ9VGJ2_SAGOE|nr:hypothetical protein P7K49_012617 [Saguinus oedipus]